MDDLGKVLSGAVLQGLFDCAKNHKNKKKAGKAASSKADSSGKSGSGFGHVLKMILIIIGAAAAAAGAVYLIYRFLTPEEGKHYSFLPFGNRDDDTDGEDYEDDPEIVKDLEEE